MQIVIAADHGGFALKKEVARYLQNKQIEILDVGCFGEESVDYPDFAQDAVNKIVSGSCELGILICGTGIGMSIAANRHPAIRAANCYDEHSAKMSREHNNANVLCLGARVLTRETALDIIRVWLESKFEGGRHQRRIDKFSRC